jgi:hypothetical protein
MPSASLEALTGADEWIAQIRADVIEQEEHFHGKVHSGAVSYQNGGKRQNDYKGGTRGSTQKSAL